MREPLPLSARQTVADVRLSPKIGSQSASSRSFIMDRTQVKSPRFKFVKLEERIAPSCCGYCPTTGGSKHGGSSHGGSKHGGSKHGGSKKG